MNVEKEIEGLVAWLRQQVENAGAKGLVFGLSGGVDSALVGALAKKAFPENALGIIMPIESKEEDEEDARRLSRAIDLDIERVDLTATYEALVKASFTSEKTLAKANIKPRLRMTTLYYYAQDRGYLVCGCSNASEFYIGYYTKYGDSGADILPIASYLKDEVYMMAEALGVPKEILEKKPTAGLFEGQTDEKEMGFSYRELNAYIRGDKKGPNGEKIARMHRASAHKRVFAPKYERKDIDN